MKIRPQDIHPGVFDAHRGNAQWEGFKGFIRGFLPAATIALVVGAVVGTAALVLGPAVGIPLMAEGATIASYAGAIGLFSGIMSAVAGVAAGISGANKGVRSAHALNSGIDRIKADYGIAQPINDIDIHIYDLDNPKAANPVARVINKVPNVVETVSDHGPTTRIREFIDSQRQRVAESTHAHDQDGPTLH